MTTDANLPEPIVPAEVELHDFQYMPLDVRRLRDSRLVATHAAEEVVAAIMLWASSWHQIPAASLPDDDVELSALAGYGGIRGVKLFREIKAGALYGFVKCSDGRWYHPVVAEKALSAWQAKIDKAHYKDKDRYRKLHGNVDRFPTVDAWNEARVSGGSGLDFRWNAQAVPAESVWHSAGSDRDQGDHSDGIPPDLTPKGREGKGIEGKGDTYSLTPLSESSAEPPISDCPHKDLLALFRKHLPMLTQPRVWDGARAAAMKSRWTYCSKPNGVGKGYRTREEGLAYWERFFAYVAKQKKLTEGIPYTDGSGTVWKPDLPWLIKPENFAKVVEGKYE